MSPSKFRTIVNDEKKLLTDLCEKWEKVLKISSEGNDQSTNEEEEDGPPSSRTRSKTNAAAAASEERNEDTEEVQQPKPTAAVIQDEELIGLVRATTGQGRMLLAQRFVQFEKLIDDAENKTSEKPIGDDDLQGFWDMIGFQVDDMKEKFQVLESAEANDWKLPETKIQDEPKPVAAKPKISKPPTSGTASTTKKPAGGSSGVRDFIAQKRREAAAAKKKQQEEAGN